MTFIKPARRWQQAFYPFKRVKIGRRVEALAKKRLELLVKKIPLFGCRMCGNCLLRETAFTMSMECPKATRSWSLQWYHS